MARLISGGISGALGLVVAVAPALAQAPGQWFDPSTAPVAEDAPEPEVHHDRWSGDAASSAYGAPIRFIFELRRERRLDQAVDVDGMIAALDPTVGIGAVDGQCLVDRCLLGADFPEGGHMVMELDLSGPLPNGRFTMAPDSWSAPVFDGTLTFTGPGPAVVDVSDEEVTEALNMAGFPIDRWSGDWTGSLIEWQVSAGRPVTGMLGPEDWAGLSAAAKAATEVAGWRRLTDEAGGYALFYPAKVATVETALPDGRRFAARDDSLVIEVRMVPAVDDDTFDALYDQLKEDTPERDVHSASRINNVIDIEADGDAMMEHLSVVNGDQWQWRLLVRVKGEEADPAPLSVVTLEPL